MSREQDAILLRREAEKFMQKKHRYEKLQDAVKASFKQALKDPKVKKQVARELGGVIRDTETGQVDPVIRSLMSRDGFTWSK